MQEHRVRYLELVLSLSAVTVAIATALGIGMGVAEEVCSEGDSVDLSAHRLR